jgi:hypothetical protein
MTNRSKAVAKARARVKRCSTFSPALPQAKARTAKLTAALSSGVDVHHLIVDAAKPVKSSTQSTKAAVHLLGA